MQKSESIKEIAKAISLFQMKCEKIKKDAKNPFFKSNYASLSNILDVIAIPLQESGLSFSQFPDGDGLTTILMHNESGEYFMATYSIHPAKVDPQGIGSAITYARRYALGAILGLNIDEDDDGNAASKQTASKTDDGKWLNPKDENWAAVVNALRTKKRDLNQIKTAFKLSKTTELVLIKEVESA